MTEDPFYEFYDRDDLTYGLKPSAEIASYVQQASPRGLAIDLGAGPGRNSLALARAGMRVRAIDVSRRGMQLLDEMAAERRLGHLIQTEVADVRDFVWPDDKVGVIVATTVLDHIPIDSANQLWTSIERVLARDGVVYAEVHTTEDPGCDRAPGNANPYPVSETAGGVVHYFGPGELLEMATRSGEMRVLRYEERQEWDYTHGDEHHHGKAVLLAVRKGFFPPWYGHPLAFPRKVAKEKLS